MTARDRLDPARLAALPKDERLAALRDSIERVPGRVGAVAPPPGAPRTGQPEGGARAPVLPVPEALAPVFPDGGLRRGSTVVYTGTSTVLLGLLAAVTADGAWAAIVGGGRRGLLAFHEMGGELARLAVIRDPGADPLTVVAALVDGIDLVVLDTRVPVPPARARTLAGRVRNQRSVLLAAGQDWPHPDLRVRTRLTGAHGLGHGRGRLQGLELEVGTLDRAGRARAIGVVLDGAGGRTAWTTAGGRTAWATVPGAPDAAAPDAADQQTG